MLGADHKFYHTCTYIIYMFLNIRHVVAAQQVSLCLLSNNNAIHKELVVDQQNCSVCTTLDACIKCQKQE